MDLNLTLPPKELLSCPGDDIFTDWSALDNNGNDGDEHERCFSEMDGTGLLKNPTHRAGGDLPTFQRLRSSHVLWTFLLLGFTLTIYILKESQSFYDYCLKHRKLGEI